MLDPDIVSQKSQDPTVSILERAFVTDSKLHLKSDSDSIDTKNTNHLELYFSSEPRAELVKAKFFLLSQKRLFVSVRGRTVAPNAGGTFLWSSAVRAISLLLVDGALAAFGGKPAGLEGEKGSLASSLDYSISKEPCWLTELFGADSNGNCNIRRIICRSNSELRSAGPVRLWLNKGFLAAEDIVIFSEGKRVTSLEEIQNLKRQLTIEAKVQGITNAAPTIEKRTSPLISSILSTASSSLSYREDWLPLTNPIASEAHSCIRAVVPDSEIPRWWHTLHGQTFFATNLKLLKRGRKVKRIFILKSQEREARLHLFRAALVQNALGVEVGIVEDLNELEKITGKAQTFSVMDDTFAAVHNPYCATGTTKFLTKDHEISEHNKAHEECLRDPKISKAITAYKKEFDNDPVFCSSVEAQIIAWKVMTADQKF